MVTQPFDSCWQRWERANQRRTDLQEVWNSYISNHPYGFSLDQVDEGVFVLRVWQEEPMPSELALTAGEWLYNLRSCLDYIIWATAVYTTGELPPPNESRLQYPIYDREEEWKRNLTRLRALEQHHREILEMMQPFRSDPDANYLGWINRLARIDRHRRMIDGTSYLAEIDPVFAVPAGVKAELQWGDRVLANGEASVARLTVTPWASHMTISCNPRIGIDPEIGEWAESPFWSRIRFSKRLTMLQVFVESEIAIYEYDCVGESRKEDLLTEAYRGACDERKPSRKAAFRTTDRPVRWSEPISGRPSMVEMLEGLDFPRGPDKPR